MTYANGLLPASALDPIPGGHLRKDAAAAFNAMNAEAQHRFGVTLHVRDSYRPLGRPGDFNRGIWSQWAAWERCEHGGNLAARPGTSNHGLGLAVDLFDQHQRWVVDQIGAKYGWAKKWSDAPGEWWHLKWQPGIWHPAPAGPPTIHEGMRGVWVSRAQNALRAAHVAGAPRTTGYFGPLTTKAVKRYQRKHRLPASGVIGPRTWAQLRHYLN